MNGQGRGLRNRQEECERGEICCGVITESSYSLVRLAACVCELICFPENVCASEWDVKFAHSSEQVCASMFVCSCVSLEGLIVHSVYQQHNQ